MGAFEIALPTLAIAGLEIPTLAAPAFARPAKAPKKKSLPSGAEVEDSKDSIYTIPNENKDKIRTLNKDGISRFKHRQL